MLTNAQPANPQLELWSMPSPLTSTARRNRTTQPDPLSQEAELVAAALALGAREVPAWSAEEDSLTESSGDCSPTTVAWLRRQILGGADPLGEGFASLRSPAERRTVGATYTPLGVVKQMVAWAKERYEPHRVVDPGSGSGRFLVEAARAFPRAKLLGIEIDPLAAMLARANLAVIGAARRSRIVLSDYRTAMIPVIRGRTLYVGNPPYVRHHGIDKSWKTWFSNEALAHGYRASQLAGLHVHFFLVTALAAKEGDYGALITAAEWLDVNYGSLVRELFLDRLGGLGITIVEPTSNCFPDAATTSAVTTFEIGAKPAEISLSRVSSSEELNAPTHSTPLRRETLQVARRWSRLTQAGHRLPAGHVELGELFRVHRGQVTGANHVWIAGPHSADLPAWTLIPAVTKARELIEAGPCLEVTTHLRRVIDLPSSLDEIEPEDRRAIAAFLKIAKGAGADRGYVAQNRKAWWAVGLKEPAPILATYMARRSPVFVRNQAEARHLNIAHGLYPRQAFDALFLSSVTRYLSSGVWTGMGRVYAGGLIKFEPREMERIPVPEPRSPALLQ